MELTRLQIITISALVAYSIWEICVYQWAIKNVIGSSIRIDIFIIWPILLVLVILSVVEVCRKPKNDHKSNNRLKE